MQNFSDEHVHLSSERLKIRISLFLISFEQLTTAFV